MVLGSDHILMVALFEYQGGSDAGGVMTGGSLIEFRRPLVDTVFKCHFDEDDQKESSTFRELKKIKFDLDLLKEKFQIL